MAIYLLGSDPEAFPDPRRAPAYGPAALGGDLQPRRLIAAYRRGFFPWYGEGEPILWWSPHPRFVLFPDELKVHKSMRPYFNQRKFELSYDRAFDRVIRACAHVPRRDQQGTWITSEMIQAYERLHALGVAHSVEVWQAGRLVGGLYGVALGRVFFGESMFARVSNASKFGFISLVRALQQRGFVLIDCQQETPHLASLGARAIPRAVFLDFLRRHAQPPDPPACWQSWLSAASGC